MALTAQQQTSLLQLAQVMFNASPGATYLDVLGAQLTAGQSLADLAQTLVGTELFLGKDYADLSAIWLVVTLLMPIKRWRLNISSIEFLREQHKVKSLQN